MYGKNDMMKFERDLPNIPEETSDDDDDNDNDDYYNNLPLFDINRHSLSFSRPDTSIAEPYHSLYDQKSKHVKLVVTLFLLSVYVIKTSYNLWMMEQFKLFGSIEVSKVNGSISIRPAVTILTATTSSVESSTGTVQQITQRSSNNASISIREYLLQTYNLLLPSDNTTGSYMKLEQIIQQLEFAYTTVNEMNDRQYRFPSVAERVKIYMSTWYVPPCNSEAKIKYEYVESKDYGSNYDGVVVRIQELSLQLQQDLVIENEKQNQRGQRVVDIFHSADASNSFDEVFTMDRDIFLNGSHQYQKDFVEFFLPSLDRHLQNETGTDQSIPILYQFGDLQQSHAKQVFKNETHNEYLPVRNPRIPIIQKVRTSMSSKKLKAFTDTVECYCNGERRGMVSEMPNTNAYNRVHLEPIILKLKTQRHYSNVYKVAEKDTLPWEEKKNMAVFRGALTGLYPDTIDKTQLDQLSVVERCRLIPRCWITYRHSLSKWVDAKLTAPDLNNEAVALGITQERDRMIPRSVRPVNKDVDNDDINAPTVDLFGDRMSMDELLKYKVLIMLEGNDISSGLKWALFSNCVVMMPEPTLTSWAMEEKLQAWVHYVPINIHKDNQQTGKTDIEEKMQWILNNEERAKKIVRASSLWIADLVLHPDVKQDEDIIFDEIARRYIQHFDR